MKTYVVFVFLTALSHYVVGHPARNDKYFATHAFGIAAEVDLLRGC